MKFTTKGLIAPVFTPFKENGDLNLSVIPEYASKILKDDFLTGILINGTSGEGMSMSTAERKLVTEHWVQAIKNINCTTKPHIMIQVGGTSMPDVLELAKHAESLHVDSILCLPDLYMKPKNNTELGAYLSLVSKAAPKTPLLYYHIPMFTNVNLHMGQFLHFMKIADIPTFVGIKFTSNDLDEGYEAAQEGFAVFLGADTLMLSASMLNIDSAIATTLNFYQHLIMDEKTNYLKKQKQQLDLAAKVKIITKDGYGWVPSMKAAMNLLSINCGPVRPPLLQLSQEQINNMSKLLSNFKPNDV